jgi:hypothetical protein
LTKVSLQLVMKGNHKMLIKRERNPLVILHGNFNSIRLHQHIEFEYKNQEHNPLI